MSGKGQEKYTAQNQIALPMLPMRDIVVFPHMTAPFFIGRSLSIASLEKALDGDRQIFVVLKKIRWLKNLKARICFE